MVETRDLTNELEQAEGLLRLLRAIEDAYQNLSPEIVNLGDEIEQAEKLLGLLRAIEKEATD